MDQDVWITGVGLVTSIGIGRDAFWSAALEGCSGAVRLSHPLLQGDQFTTLIGAPVKGFDPMAAGLQEKDVRVLDVTSQYAIAAALEAVADAGFELELVNARKGIQSLRGMDPGRVAVSIGSGIGGLTTIVDTLLVWHQTRRRSACDRYGLPKLIPNAPAAQVAVRIRAQGECKSSSTACAAGAMAIGDALRLIRLGEADVVVCGGVEGMLSDSELYGLMGFDLLKTMSRRNHEPERASRPFDKDRDGFVLSEGAGILVLERASHARARGARPYASLLGYAATCDAHSIMQIDPDGAQIERAVRLSLERAGLSPSDIQYVNAHGTSTQLNDKVESQVFRRVFGAHADALAVTSTKSMTGHGIAASGAIEVIATALTLKHGRIPPTINYETPDPDCDLDYVPNQARAASLRYALSGSYGFGGHNACLVLGRE